MRFLLNRDNKLPLLTLLRLSLFQACLGCLAVIFAGMLNRIMISELAFPAILVGGGLAFEQLMAPSRVLFGNISDSWPIRGRKRTPYIWLGAAGFCSMAVLSIPLIFITEEALRQGSLMPIALCSVALCILFSLYGLAVSMATTPYLALVIDLTNEQERPKAIGIIWCMLTIGIIVGAIAIAITTKGLDGVSDVELLEPALQKFMIRVSAIVLAISIFACWGIEPKNKKIGTGKTKQTKEIGLKEAWSLITSSPQIIIFFTFLILYTLGLFLQDPILESYGAEVFNLPISKTTLLNAFWGGGTLFGLLLGGLWVTPRLGKLSTARIGCWMIIVSLGLLIISGSTQTVNGLYGVLVIFGVAAGLATNSALSLMLDLTLPEVAGTFVGVWGLAQALSRAMGKVFGGGLLDIGRAITAPENTYMAFAFVFLLEIIVMVLAILVLEKVSVKRFREETSTKMETFMMAELDA
ncbi:BCD family MFS transporter [Prochlorococcus sp. MIT 1307]|uniref:BCD family MFS transporter n=1 Tax=Prochlorococcus sp. MIT 1307 TaxID=3096219 RepID=UPI002A758839|nr:BCD family MFS transporter [Prochlorococcus sp. MIT 1307]